MRSRAGARDERGQTLLLACVSMVVLIAMAGMAIDVATFYVARTEAQRAADASALAGAYVFVSSGCTSSQGTSNSCGSAAVQRLVRQQAESVGGQNKVFGQPANIADGDVTFPPSSATNPLVQVHVHRTMASYFAAPLKRLLGGGGGGLTTVGATSTAEAFNPSGSGTPFSVSCVKPWVIGNCDPNHSSPANGNCPGYGTLVNSNNTLSHPGPYPTGVIGAQWQLHVNTAPSQYGDVSFGAPDNSGANYRTNIESCSSVPISCGDTVYFIPGDKVGPTDQGVDNLINANGQDTIVDGSGNPIPDTTPPGGGAPPLTVKAGSNNPLVTAGLVHAGDPIPFSSSSSVVTVPIFDGQNIPPGANHSTTVVGYLQLFVQNHMGNGVNDHVNAVVLNVISCGANSGSGSGPVVGSGGNQPIPVRLVRNPGT